MGDAVGGRTSGGANPLAIVASVTVAVAGFVPSSTAVEGEGIHIELAGAPAQFHVTVPMNPEAAGVAEIVKLVCCPAVTVALGCEAETL